MSSRTFVSRTAALVALVALGAACETKTVVTPPPPSPITVTVSPASATLTTAGQTVQFVALVGGGDATTARTVTWASSNTAVATVDASGVAKAVANGTASIIATSTADGTAKGAGLVTVNIPVVVPPPPPTPPTVSIAGIFAGNLNTPANANNIAGTIFVQANADNLASSGAASVNFNVTGPGGTKQACSQAITQGKSAPGQVTTEAASAVTFLCQIKTDSLNATTGVPIYANGAYTLTVAVADANGKQLASSSQAVMFNNVDALNIALAPFAAANTAFDAAGLKWNGGPGGHIVVNVTPAVFDNQTLQTAIVSVSGNVTASNGTQTATTVSKTITTTGNAPFTVTFRADSTPAKFGVMGMEDANTTVQATGTVTTAGQQFAGNVGVATLRYDAAPPAQVSAVTLGPASGFQNGFFNMNATFANGSACTLAAGTFTCLEGVTATDFGVDKVTSTFQTSPSTGTAVWTTQASATSMGNVPAGSLIARVQVCDALGNCANSASSAAFGVDILPPQFVSVTTPNNVNAAIPTISVIAQDTGAAASGFANGWLFATIVKDSAKTDGSDAKQCVDPGTGALSAVPSTGCAAVSTGSPTPAAFNYNLPPSATPDGYYTETFYAVDLAGNQSAVSTKTFLVDGNGAPGFPTVTITGINTTVSPPQIAGTAHDNVDLQRINFREQFAGLSAAIAGAPATVTSLPFQQPTVIKGFGLPLQGNANMPSSGSILVLGVQAGLGSATIYQLSGLGGDARDQTTTGYGEGFMAYAPGTGVGVTATDIASLTTYADAGAATTICQSSGCSGHPTSTSLTAVVLFNAGTTTANPITSVYFFAIDNTGHAVLLGNPVNSFTLTIPTTTNERTFTYTLPATAASTFTNLGANTVFAVGVDSKGNGVLMGPAVTVTTM